MRRDDVSEKHLVRPVTKDSCFAFEGEASDGGMQAEDKSEEEAEDAEGRRPKMMHDPKKPKPEEVEEHMATHLPYRSWCPHCVRARGIDSPHRAREKNEGCVPTIHADYMFMKGPLSKEEEGELDNKGVTPILVMKNGATGSVASMAVTKKGDSVRWVIEKCVSWIEEQGLKRIILKTDQEPAILAWAAEVKQERESETIPESSPVGDSASNGKIEAAVKEVRGMIKTLKSCLEDRIKEELPADAVILLWLIEYAGVNISRQKVHSDGKTSYEKLKGKKCSRSICEFGEKVLYMPLKPARETKDKLKYEYGIFVGIIPKSNEMCISTQDGVVKARTIRRIPKEDRWCAEAVKGVKGTPLGASGRNDKGTSPHRDQSQS